MQRIALEFLRPKMVLARDVYDQDGTIMVSAGTVLTDSLLTRLNKWEIRSVFIRNPRIELPAIPAAMQERTRNRARLMVEHAFQLIRRAEQFSLTEEETQTIHAVVHDATQDPQALVHMAHIDRNSSDILSHSVNVALLSVATALSLGISKAALLQELALAALLHDIGLLMIPQDLIVRRGSLTSEEAAIYREHASWGHTILQQSSLPDSIIHVAYEHHEHTDGTGYPKQLTGQSIHPFSRIVSAVNSYENICANVFLSQDSQRHLAYESIMAGSGTRFDLKVAKSLLSRLPMYPTGSMVELTNGLVGVVVATTSQDMPHRPQLKILASADGNQLGTPYLLDLAGLENQTLFVHEVLSDERASRFMLPADS